VDGQPTANQAADTPVTGPTVDAAGAVLQRLAEVWVDMDDVGRTLEDQGVAGFHESFAHVLGALEAKARQLVSR
jgi:transaldolase